MVINYQNELMNSVSWIMRFGLLALLIVTGLVLSAPTANSQQQLCGERDHLVRQLDLKFDEKRTAFGLAVDGHLIEVFSSASGTWTILATYPGGPTCLLSSGDSWLLVDNQQGKSVALNRADDDAMSQPHKVLPPRDLPDPL